MPMPCRHHLVVSFLLCAFLFSSRSSALPGVIAGKGDQRRVNNVTQVVIMKKGSDSIVTVWPDYEGPLDSFALVLPVPKDVKRSSLQVIKRDVVDHLDEVSAPRFHDFWEKNPCEPGEAEQEWDRDLRVKEGSGAGFLGEGMPNLEQGNKLPKEMLLELEPHFKPGEYQFQLMPLTRVSAFLKGKGLSLPSGSQEKLVGYQDAGYQALVAMVDSSKVELAGARRALLSPIRFATSQDYQLPSTLGLANSPGEQELILYVLHPSSRFEVEGYRNVIPPTNVRVTESVKERLGDFYAGYHDALRKKYPGSFLVEYAWPTDKHCGEPCPNAPIMMDELLTLGADVLEAQVPRSERNPKPPPLSDEEKAQLEEADPETRARLQEQHREVARRRALIERNRYIITRLHHRFDRAGLPKDVGVKVAEHVEAGRGVPKGPEGEVSSTARATEESRLQVRFNHLQPNKHVVECENPVHHRWGQAPRSYRGLRKVWTARDMAFKKRDRFQLAEVVTSAVPALGLTGTQLAAPAAAPDSAAAEDKEDGCTVAPLGFNARRSGLLALCLVVGTVVARRRLWRGSPPLRV